MVERLLSESAIDAGQVLLERMDEYGFVPESTAWLFDHSLGDWRYIIATAAIDVVGRRQIYSGILDIIDASDFGDSLTENDVQLVSPSEPWYSFLSSFMQVVGKSRVQLKNCAFNGVKVDALIYRFFAPPPMSQFEIRTKSFAKAARKALEYHGKR